MSIEVRTFSRAGLIGNPSDCYFGKAICLTLRNYSARVVLRENDKLVLRPQTCDRLEFGGIDDLTNEISTYGYYGGIRLIKATIKRFRDYCLERGIEMNAGNFSLEYESDIPVRVGMAGSSAIIAGTMLALTRHYGVEIPKELLPSLLLSVEMDELGISGGLMDRVIQTYEGLVFMDFDRKMIESKGHGVYEPLDPGLLPPLFVAFAGHFAEGTEVVHNPLRERFRKGDPELLKAIRTWADLAQRTRDMLLQGKGDGIGPLMDENFDLRDSLYGVGEVNRKLAKCGRELCAHINLAGSGGTLVGTYDGDPQRLESLKRAYTQIGAVCFAPSIEEPSE